MDKMILSGRIVFEPSNITKKHINQSSWKHIAMVMLDGEITEYYSWFIRKRYNLILNRPLRGAHVSFINDSFKEMSHNGNKSIHDVTNTWNSVKDKWDNVEVPIMLDLSPRTDSKHWWLNVHHEYRDRLHGIRQELGLNRPFFGLHMTIGYANEKWISHSEYIHTLIKNGYG
jgi:hypothetical protein